MNKMVFIPLNPKIDSQMAGRQSRMRVEMKMPAETSERVSHFDFSPGARSPGP
jgi:hypothetical protein